jgi:hypothetical protein
LADRNAYGLAVLALSESVKRGHFGSQPQKTWEFLGVGAASSHPDACNLGGIPDMCLQMLPSVPEPEYFEILAHGDVGLALMVSPHPSLPPLDFAAAGMVTVTNTWGSKTVADLKAVSGNIVPAVATLEGIIEGLGIAVSMAKDLEARARGSRIDWPDRWDDARCYGDPLWRQLRKWFDWEKAVW